MENSFSYTDKDLLGEIAADNTEAFRQIYNQYHDKIYNMAMRITHSESITEELVQNVFLKVWEAREKLVEVTFFNAWITFIGMDISILII